MVPLFDQAINFYISREKKHVRLEKIQAFARQRNKAEFSESDVG